MSRVVKRNCCYRDCFVTNQKNPERTLFQFPKDEDRAQRWFELGAVDTSVPGPKFMCDLHFSRIYMCFSSRRKMLLNTAIPYEYGTAGDDEEQQQQQQDEMVDGGPETVGSTSSQGAEDHAEGTEYEVLETEENPMTEIIFMEDLQQFDQEESVQLKSPTKARIIKVEKLPTVVSSSSGSPAIPTIESAQSSIILRKVKIKKRPSTAVTSPVLAKKPKQDTDPVETTTAAAVTSSPTKSAKKVQVVKVIPSPASSSNSSNTAEISKPKPVQPVKKPVKVPRSPVKPLKATIMEKRKEVINEFIFKGEEYIQLPKAVYLEDLDEMDQQLQQYRTKCDEADDVLETCKVEQEQCQAEKEQYKAENERLEKKVEEYRMIIKNMRDVLGMFETGDD